MAFRLWQHAVAILRGRDRVEYSACIRPQSNSTGQQADLLFTCACDYCFYHMLVPLQLPLVRTVLTP